MASEKSSMPKKESPDRTRNYTAVVYPDCVNTPENWVDVLADLQLQFFISPLHDKDIDDDGKPKKPHYHVILMFGSTKTRKQAEEIFYTVGAVIPPPYKNLDRFVVRDLRGASRYLCHLDQANKAQYDPNDVKSLGGVDYFATIGMAKDKYVALTEMEEFCEKYNVVSFYALSRYASVHRSDWSRILKDCGSIYMREYLQSRKWSIENNAHQIIDPESGEVII